MRQTADAADAITLRRSYNSFGVLRTAEGHGSTAYGFAGEEQDAATGHVYLRARTYNPAAGRFLQQDRVLGAPVQPNTLHRYAYAFNNPVSVVDPTGRMPALGRNVNPANAGGASVIPFNTPARSANNGGWSSYSDPVARQQSADFRPDVCGMLADLGVTLLNIGEAFAGIDRSMENFLDDVSAFVHNPRDPGHLVDAYEDLRQAGRNVTTAVEEAQRFRHRNRDTLRYLATVGFDIAAQVALAISPLDWVVDIGSYLTGRDLLTGHKLSKLEKGLLGAALLVGVFSFGLGDDVLQAGGRLSRYSDELAGAGRYADEVAGAGRYADEAALGGRYLDDVDIGAKPRRAIGSADNVRFADDVAGGRRYVDDGPSGRVVARCDNSFMAGTLVQTEESLVPIEDIEVGDRVLSEDPETGEQGYFEVVAVTNHPADEVLAVTMEAVGEEGEGEAQSSHSTTHNMMQVTPEHPVYVEGQGWLLAENLEMGDRLRRADGGMAKVLAIEQIRLDTPQPVYNFTVRGPHTYFVLDAGVLVHNASCPLRITEVPSTEDAEVIDAISRTRAEQILNLPKPPKGTVTGDVWRFLRYKYQDGRPLSFAEWFPNSRGGKLGGPAHQRIQNALTEDVHGSIKEVAIGNRVVDVYWPAGTRGNARPVYHQIGSFNRRGDPIMRERRAIDDLRLQLDKLHGQGNYEIWFHDKIGTIRYPIVNPHLGLQWHPTK